MWSGSVRHANCLCDGHDIRTFPMTTTPNVIDSEHSLTCWLYYPDHRSLRPDTAIIVFQHLFGYVRGVWYSRVPSRSALVLVCAFVFIRPNGRSTVYSLPHKTDKGVSTAGEKEHHGKKERRSPWPANARFTALEKQNKAERETPSKNTILVWYRHSMLSRPL